MTDPLWQYLAEAVRLRDAGIDVTAGAVGESLSLDKDQTEARLLSLRDRGLIEIPAQPKRLGDRYHHRSILITPAGYAAASSGRVS